MSLHILLCICLNDSMSMSVPKCYCMSESLLELIGTQTPGLLTASDSAYGGLDNLPSIKLPGDAGAAGSGAALENTGSMPF